MSDGERKEEESIFNLKIEGLKDWLDVKFTQISADNARLENRFSEFNKINASEHKEFLSNQNDHRDEMHLKLEKLRAETALNIKEVNGRVDSVEKVQGKLTIYFSILVTVLYIVMDFVSSYIKNQF